MAMRCEGEGGQCSAPATVRIAAGAAGQDHQGEGAPHYYCSRHTPRWLDLTRCEQQALDHAAVDAAYQAHSVLAGRRPITFAQLQRRAVRAAYLAWAWCMGDEDAEWAPQSGYVLAYVRRFIPIFAERCLSVDGLPGDVTVGLGAMLAPAAGVLALRSVDANGITGDLSYAREMPAVQALDEGDVGDVEGEGDEEDLDFPSVDEVPYWQHNGRQAG